MRTLVRALLSALAVMVCLTAVADTRYRLVDLGAFPDGGNDEYFPTRINDRTQILGLVLGFNAPDRAFLWQPETGLVNLPPVAGTGEPLASAIGRHEVIVGSCRPFGAGPVNQAAVWDRDHHPRLLGATPVFESFAADIAPDGTIFGEFDFQPVAWAPDGTMSVLPTPNPAFPFGSVVRRNRAGDILGYTFDPNTFATIPVIWNRRLIPTEIRTPPGTTNVSDLNNHAQVVGSQQVRSPVFPFDNITRAFVWSRDSGFAYLPGFGPTGLGGVPELAIAEGINNRGQIVGSAIPRGRYFTSAVLWENGQIIDLNTLIGPYNGWFLSTADAINNRGEITGFANQFINGQFTDHAYLLVPIHEDDDEEDE